MNLPNPNWQDHSAEYFERVGRKNIRALASAQASYDNQLPPEDDPDVEVECQRCHEIFETDKASDKYCPACDRATAIEDDE